MLPKLVVIDGHAILFRSFYAIRGLTAPDGTPTNAVYGFVKTLHKVIEKLRPQYLVVCLDAGHKTFRNEEAEDYKANRKPAPEELKAQVKPLLEVLEAMNIPCFMKEGFEADDIIATVVHRALEEGLDVVIVSRDKDFYQLLSDRVAMYDDKNDRFITPETLKEEKGITPEQVPDWLGLMGDSSDNIPGVPGVGEKTALKLLAEYGSLEAVLDAADEIAKKKRKVGANLKAHREDALRSRMLATIEPRTGVEVDLENLRLGEPDRAALAEVYRKLGFSSLLGGLFEQGAARPAGVKWRIVRDEEALRQAVREIEEAGAAAFDTETTSFAYHSGKLLGISLAWKEGEGVYVPVADSYPDARGGMLDLARLREILGPLFASPRVVKAAHNLKFDMSFLKAAGFEVKPPFEDTLIAAWLLDPERRSLKLDALALDLLGVSKIPITDLIGKGKQQKPMEEVPLDRLAEYSAEDAAVTLALWRKLKPRLEEEGLDGPYRELEIPLVPVISDMELRGIKLEKSRLEKLAEGIRAELAQLERKIYEAAGREFNVNSTYQLAEVLYDELKLPAPKSRTTDAAHLKKLKDKHPLPGLVLRYRLLQKLNSTYVEALPQYVDPVTGAIHSSFNQTGTATGRLSSNRPNLQNIPARNDEAKEIRSAFVAREGFVFVSADYSQVELRMLAHLSGDPGLTEAFRQGEDIHATVARQIFETEEEGEVTPSMRAAAKAVNFGLIYGQGPFGLANFLGISRTQAREFIQRYFERFPKVEEFRRRVIEEAREKGHVETIGGRRRPVPQLRSSNAAERAHGERLAINTVVQGSAADLIKKAMIRIHRRVKEERLPFHLLLQIHDELLFEVPEDRADEARRLVEGEMTGAMKLRVPLKVSVGCGRDWLELK